MIHVFCGLIEFEIVHVFGDFFDGDVQMFQRRAGFFAPLDSIARPAASLQNDGLVHQHKPADVPHFVGEIAIPLYFFFRNHDVVARRIAHGERHAERVRAVLFHHAERVNHIAF